MSRSHRIVVIGAGGVGKSAFTIQFVTSTFVETYDPTLEDSYRQAITVDDQPTMLNIYDTAGQEDFFSIRDQYIRTGEGFICVYSITSEATFEHVRDLRDRIVDISDTERHCVVLVGNKSDLEHERKVGAFEGERLAAEFGWTFMESSAKTKTNVVEAFEEVVRMLRRVAQEKELKEELARGELEEGEGKKKKKKVGGHRRCVIL
eukprot:TRINITY_DN639_c0_g3_i1.p1 TRINITY_DN639_c0_g3~~TRINITY_DN639_c0_g3_i1.p1  ORF type:complete len:205 (-),score=30.60 TRINITY_DN639_c0_g3_i1:55-669(-)